MASLLVVRKFDDFSRILTEAGFPVINCPAIETAPIENLRDLGAKISAGNYDGVFLTSRAAAEIAARELFREDFDYAGKVYVLGKSSFERLKDLKLDLYFDETANTAREMLASIPAAELKNKRFLFVRGERSLRAVPDFLKKTAAVEETIVYRTRRVAIREDLKKEIAGALKNDRIAAACFFSPSGAESFLEQCGAEMLHQTKIAAIGSTTAEYFAGRNLSADFTASKATAEDFAVELIDYLKAFGPRKTRKTQK